MSADVRTANARGWRPQQRGATAAKARPPDVMDSGQRIVVLGLALLVGWLPHHKRNKEVNARARQEKNALPVVDVQTVHAQARSSS